MLVKVLLWTVIVVFGVVGWFELQNAFFGRSTLLHLGHYGGVMALAVAIASLIYLQRREQLASEAEQKRRDPYDRSGTRPKIK